jgi:predicted ATP-dependent endonuclease of OLD family
MLGDRKINVVLTECGSRTRNPTLIFLALFTAKQISQSPASASKITPVFVIEEPESFLHPSAQGAFGRILQDLSAEFQLQVITTTHSPYMLNLNDPTSNILLKRCIRYNQQRETRRVDTSGDNWMEPFGEALGVRNAEFEPWRAVFFFEH